MSPYAHIRQRMKSSVTSCAHPLFVVTKLFAGKWPFQRILGMQEVASVAFSLLNLLAHVAGITDLWRAVRAAPRTQRGAYPFAWLWTAHSVLHVFCWASRYLQTHTACTCTHAGHCFTRQHEHWDGACLFSDRLFCSILTAVLCVL